MNAWSSRLCLLAVVTAAALVAVRAAVAVTPADDLGRAARPQQAGPDPSKIDVRYETVLSNELSFAVDVTHAGDGSGRLFIVEKSGRIRILQGGSLKTDPFLNITDRVESAANEQGLFGLAFHPSYRRERPFLRQLHRRRAATPDRPATQVSPTDPNRRRPGSATMLLSIDQPRGQPQRRQLGFGPDGYLYIGIGDGGGGGDPHGNGQNLDTLLGKILRIDVERRARPAVRHPAGQSVRRRAGAPARRSGPWACATPGASASTALTGDLYIADVGQDAMGGDQLRAGRRAGGAELRLERHGGRPLLRQRELQSERHDVADLRVRSKRRRVDHRRARLSRRPAYGGFCDGARGREADSGAAPL